MKKKCLLLLVMLFAVILSSCGGGDGVITIPDENFKRALLQYDISGDGQICELEANYVKMIYCSSKNIKSLEGIEYFTNLEVLECRNNQLTSLNVSKNIKLQKLFCGSNQLTKLEIENNVELLRLDCDNNQLSSLDISMCLKLNKLECYSNLFISLDFSNNPHLSSVQCNKMPALKTIYLKTRQKVNVFGMEQAQIKYKD